MHSFNAIVLIQSLILRVNTFSLHITYRRDIILQYIVGGQMQNDSNKKQILWVSDLPLICKSKTLFDRLRLRLRLRPSLLSSQKTNKKKAVISCTMKCCFSVLGVQKSVATLYNSKYKKLKYLEVEWW